MNDNTTVTVPTDLRPVNWKYAVYAGLIAGGIFLMVSRGIPWASGLMSPTVMGRELSNPSTVDPGLGLAAAALHLIFSIGYALMLAPIVNRLRPPMAIVAGGVLGLALYFLNNLLFSSFFNQVQGARESIAVVTHIAFGMVAAGAYKGFVRRHRQPVVAPVL